MRIRVRGLVQGVGFRPMVWRLARQHDLKGQVLNDGEGVLIDLCGLHTKLEAFVTDLPGECRNREFLYLFVRRGFFAQCFRRDR